MSLLSIVQTQRIDTSSNHTTARPGPSRRLGLFRVEERRCKWASTIAAQEHQRVRQSEHVREFHLATVSAAVETVSVSASLLTRNGSSCCPGTCRRIL